MKTEADVLVVGGGIVGLATARALQLRKPGAHVVVIDKEADIARHQTGNNSGVIHAGVYYTPGSYKARLCFDGRVRLVEYLQDKGIPHRIDGKLGVQTRAGVRKAQAALGLPADSYPTPELIARLQAAQ